MTVMPMAQRRMFRVKRQTRYPREPLAKGVVKSKCSHCHACVVGVSLTHPFMEVHCGIEDVQPFQTRSVRHGG